MPQMLISCLILSLVYYSGRLIWMALWKMYEKHYLIGFKPRLFEISIVGIKFSIGLYLPLPFLSRIYCLKDEKKQKIRYVWEYHEVPLTKRLIAAFGGVVALFLTAIIINVAIAYFCSESFISKDEVNKYGIYPTAIGEKAGFKSGDKVLTINDREPESLNDIFDFRLAVSEENVYSVLRGNEILEVTIPQNHAGVQYNSEEPLFAGVLFPFEIVRVVRGSGAEAAGLKTRDKILRINQVPVTNLYDFKREMSKTTANAAILTVGRAEKDTIFEAHVSLDNDKNIGVGVHEIISYTTKENTFRESMIKGVSTTFNFFFTNLNGIATVLSRNTTTTKALSGPIGIAEIYSDDSLFNIRFWEITSVLALTIVLYNLLPLPKSAITQIIPLTYEVITGGRFSVINYNRIRKMVYFIMIALLLIIVFYDTIGFLGA